MVPVEIDLCGDWLVGSLCLFLGQVLGYNLDLMERNADEEFQNLTSIPGCVAHGLCDPVHHHPGESSFSHL